MSAELNESRTIVVGGGISGLSTAYFLKTRGVPVTLISDNPRPGGLIESLVLDGSVLETGPDSFLATKTAVAELAGELGIASEIMPSNDLRRRTYIVREGRLEPVPPGMVLMVPTDLEAARATRLWGEDTEARFRDELQFPPRDRLDDVSVGEFVNEHFGSELLEYVAEPLLAAVYGGDPARLSARSVLPRFVDAERKEGSLIRALRPVHSSEEPSSIFQSFRLGMGQLPDCLYRELTGSMRVGTVIGLARAGTSSWIVQLEGGETLSCRQVVLAIPAYRAASVIAAACVALANLLQTIPYSSAILVNLLYHRASFPHPLDGFGFLVPQKERRTIAAMTWVNTKFPSRVASDLVCLRAFIVDPQATDRDHSDDASIIRLTRDDLRQFMGVQLEPNRALIRRWPQSMPQYVVGHAKMLGRLKRELDRLPGLHVVSNYLGGIGIPDCIREARLVAHQIAREAKIT